MKSRLQIGRSVLRAAVFFNLLALVALFASVPQPVHAEDPGNGIGGAPQGGPIKPAGAIVPGPTWYEFSFLGVGSTATGCAPADPAGQSCVPSSGGNSVFADAPPWTFTGSARLLVTDAFAPGDQFEVFDGATSLGLTSLPGTGTSCSDPVPCFADPNFSSGMFPLGPGAHSITIKAVLSLGAGAAFFRLGEPPEPRCTVTQNHTYASGTLTLEWSLQANVPTTWDNWVVIGSSAVPIGSAPLAAIDPAVTVGPYSTPVPPIGTLGFLTTLSTPSGILCWDFDLVDTGEPRPSSPKLSSAELGALLPDLLATLPDR